ncbi:mandelate racemase/muconate lactonizing enzyme family protein [Candidatus Latescibacterota bacterium]
MNRRTFLKSTSLTTAGASFCMGFHPEEVQAKLPGGIKITDVKPFMVDTRVYVKVYTNKGVTGVGEGSITGQAKGVAGAIEDRGRIIMDRDPTNIEFLWQAMWRWPRARGGQVDYSAVSAIDIALWDILGKLLDEPIYKILGGKVRDSVRVYAHVGGRTPEAVYESVMKRKEEGYTAVRTGIAWSSRVIKRPWNLQLAEAIIKAMRKAAGEDMDITDDAHGLMTPTMVLEYVNAVEPYRLMYIEDPVQPENIEGLEWIQKHTNIPIAIGESNYARVGFKEIVKKCLANYLRPDVVNTGGITETKKIAALAEAQFIDVIPHGSGSPVRNLATTHISACCPNCVMQEPRGGTSGWMLDLFKGDDIVVKDGYAQLPEKPGLGCDLDEKVAAAHPYKPTTKPQIMFDDGSVSDW